MPQCGVNRQIIELLSIRPPPVEAKMKLVKEIAEKHEIDWDPSATETEYLKPHEDLLNGPTYFNGSTLPLPKEKREETVAASAVDQPNEDYESCRCNKYRSIKSPKKTRRAPRGRRASKFPARGRAPQETRRGPHAPGGCVGEPPLKTRRRSHTSGGARAAGNVAEGVFRTKAPPAAKDEAHLMRHHARIDS